MGNAVLNIGAVVDKDAIVDGMEGAAAGVKVSVEQMGVYFTELRGRANSAWKKIAEDTREGATVVSAQALRVAEAAKAAAAAHKELAAAVSLTRNPTVDAAIATSLHAAAIEKDKAAVLELAAATKALNGETERMIPEQIAASAAIRSFEGNPGIRAVEFFVSSTLGMRGLLTNLFPIVGAVAFADILFGMGEKFVDLTTKALNSGKAIKQAIEEMDQPLQDAIDRQAILNSKLQDEIDKLEKHPGNGLRTALLEATEQADELLVALKDDTKALKDLLEKNAVSVVATAFTGVASTGTQAKEILKDREQFQQDIHDIDVQAAAARAKTSDPAQLEEIGRRNAEAIRNRFQIEIDTYKRAATQLRDEEANARALVMGGVRGAETVDNQAKIGNVNAVIDKLEKRQALIKLETDATPLQAKVGQLNQQKGDSEAAKKAEEEQRKAAEAERKASADRLRGMESEYGQLQQMHRVTLKEEHDFWAARVGEFAKGSEQYKQLQDKIGQIDQQGAEKAHESLSKLIAAEKAGSAADPEAAASVAKAMEDVNRLLREQAEDASRTGERWQSYNAAVAKGAEIAAKLQESMEEGRLRILEQEHGISALGAAQQQAAIHAQEHARALKVLQDELAALHAAGANLKPGDKGYEQNATQQQNVQNQIQQETGQGQVQAQADQAAIGTAISKPYLTAFNAIDAGWMKVQRDLIQGNRNISRDFAQMGLNLVQTMAAHIEQMLANWVRMEIRTVAMHAAANAQKLANDTAAATAGAAISKTSELTQGLVAAKLAFKNTYAAVSAIPVIGPFIAPPIAAAAFVAVEAFEQGGVVRGGAPYQMGVPILAHAGERVLTYDQTQNFDRMVNRPGSSGQTINIGGSHSYSGSGASDFRSELQKHRMYLVKTLKKLKREGHI